MAREPHQAHCHILTSLRWLLELVWQTGPEDILCCLEMFNTLNIFKKFSQPLAHAG